MLNVCELWESVVPVCTVPYHWWLNIVKIIAVLSILQEIHDPHFLEIYKIGFSVLLFFIYYLHIDFFFVIKFRYCQKTSANNVKIPGIT